MRRVRNWDVALVLLANKLNGRKFRWGTTDCGAVVIRAIRVMYPKSPLPKLKWTSLSTARATLKRVDGFESVLRAAGAERVEPNFARAGDVIIDGEGKLGSVGIVIGSSKILTARHDIGAVELRPFDRFAECVVMRLAE